MLSKVTIVSLLLMIVLISLVQTTVFYAPPLSTRPDRFPTKEELKKYLQEVHAYYRIGRGPRYGRSDSLNYAEHSVLSTPDDDLFHFFDINKDGYISKDEFALLLKFKK